VGAGAGAPGFEGGAGLPGTGTGTGTTTTGIGAGGAPAGLDDVVGISSRMVEQPTSASMRIAVVELFIARHASSSLDG